MSRPATEISPGTPATDERTGSENVDVRADADGAVDTLAAVLRTMGEYGFELSEDEHETFVLACRAWARHVLTGAPVPAAAAPYGREVAAHTGGERAWADVNVFYRERRRAERGFVNSRVNAFKGIIWEMVDGLRVISQSGEHVDVSIHDSLSTLESAVESGSLDIVRAALGTAVTDIHSALEQQRTDLDHQLSRMSERLDDMRDDLLSARRAMELDPLTKLYNRGAFDSALKRYVDLASLSGQTMVLFFVDVDHFKKVNDTHGHQAGDQALVAISDCLTRCFLRKNDFVARYGGEEFAVILFDTPQEYAPRLAERLLESVRGLEVCPQDVRIPLTCSAGYTVLAPGDTPESVVARADAALYRAKAGGRDRAETP